jgi:hypothetical protein
MMTKAHRQEGLSRAYMQAVAARCGLSVDWRGQDYGIDLTLFEIVSDAAGLSESGLRVDVQLKSTTTPAVQATEVFYDLEVKAYHRLRLAARVDPRLLVLLVLPADEGEWLSISEEHLLLRRCAYWLDLRGRPTTRNTSTVRVALPRANVFSPDQLNRLIADFRKEKKP